MFKARANKSVPVMKKVTLNGVLKENLLVHGTFALH
jgi:hypothetical protein